MESIVVREREKVVDKIDKTNSHLKARHCNDDKIMTMLRLGPSLVH